MICDDRSLYLVCIDPSVSINVVGWVQLQKFHLSDSKVTPVSKFLINVISIFFQFSSFANCQLFGILYVTLVSTLAVKSAMRNQER